MSFQKAVGQTSCVLAVFLLIETLKWRSKWS